LRVARRPRRDPPPQHAVLRRVGPEALAALVRELGGGLEQQQAAVGVDRVHPPGEKVARQRVVILARVLPAQRQLEAALAVLVSVARPGVATRLGEDGHDVVAEGGGGGIRRSRGGGD
jgi:hypothetical protein